jgi:hypothetical protein
LGEGAGRRREWDRHLQLRIEKASCSESVAVNLRQTGTHCEASHFSGWERLGIDVLEKDGSIGDGNDPGDTNTGPHEIEKGCFLSDIVILGESESGDDITEPQIEASKTATKDLWPVPQQPRPVAEARSQIGVIELWKPVKPVPGGLSVGKCRGSPTHGQHSL